MVGMEPRNGVSGTEKWCLWNREMVSLEPRKGTNARVSKPARNGSTTGLFGISNAYPDLRPKSL